MAGARMKSLLAGLPILLVPTALAMAAPAGAEAQLRIIHPRVASALATPNRAFLDQVAASDFLMIDTSGNWLGRPQFLDRSHASWLRDGTAHEDVKVRVFGSVALVHGLLAAGARGSDALRMRYTFVYSWIGSRWQLVNVQLTALRDGIAHSLQQGQAPAHAPWRGTNPAGDDLAVLRNLNASYVRAFREADVAWYDAHLAPDYVVVSSDGSMQDRARALADFAEPYFATYMRSFPVNEVRIRRFGNVALIHAENAYERKDGRRGVNRYTDIWQKQADGRWLCLAAHITTHKPPT